MKTTKSPTPLKKHHPKNPLLSPRFADIATFARLPHSQDLSSADALIVGIPFDGGTTYRPGARFAPRSIRNASCMNRNVHPETLTHLYEHLSVVDFGDINCNPLNLQQTFTEIAKNYQFFNTNKVTPIAMGGDHSILYPILKTLKKRHHQFGLIQFDAHTDTADQAWGEKFHHGTPVRRLIEEGILKGSNVYQIGIRGALTAKDQLLWDKKQGIHQLTIEDFAKNEGENFFKKINRKIPYYLSFDIDGIDPAFAPGTGTPVIGGLSSREALLALRKLRGLNFIGFDLVEVCPAYDHAEITTLLASQLMFEFLHLLTFSKR